MRPLKGTRLLPEAPDTLIVSAWSRTVQRLPCWGRWVLMRHRLRCSRPLSLRWMTTVTSAGSLSLKRMVAPSRAWCRLRLAVTWKWWGDTDTAESTGRTSAGAASTFTAIDVWLSVGVTSVAGALAVATSVAVPTASSVADTLTVADAPEASVPREHVGHQAWLTPLLTLEQTDSGRAESRREGVDLAAALGHLAGRQPRCCRSVDHGAGLRVEG